MLEEYLSFAWDSIMHRSTRSLLTVLGIMIGIGAIVALIAVGQGLQDTINTQFEKIGSNRIIISPGAIFMGPTGSGLVSSKLDESDLKVVQRVPGISIARGGISRTATGKFAGKSRDIMVMGAPTDQATVDFMDGISFFSIDKGRQLGGGNYEVVLGNKVGERIFNETIRIGDRIEINGYDFKVVGIQSKSGTGMYDIMVRIPLDTTKSIFNISDEYTIMFSSVKEGYNVSNVAENIKEALRKERGEEEGKETFTVQTTEQVISGFSTILGAMQVVFIGIASISLIVGGVGIMNSMYTSVLERTRQIGIMKAVGARNSDILGMFIVEAGMLGMIGGILGVAAGAGLSLLFNWLAENVMNVSFKSVVTLQLVLGALAFAFIIGMISGFFPAQRAARMKPTEAMRI